MATTILASQQMATLAGEDKLPVAVPTYLAAITTARRRVLEHSELVSMGALMGSDQLLLHSCHTHPAHGWGQWPIRLPVDEFLRSLGP